MDPKSLRAYQDFMREYQRMALPQYFTSAASPWAGIDFGITAADPRAGILEKLKAAEPQKVDASVLLKVPDFTQALTGWRTWKVAVRQDGRLGLKAASGDKSWRAKEKIPAVCTSQSHAAPQRDCQCGYWAYKEPVESKLLEWGQDIVIGPVNLWGRVIEHEEGWRAQFAYPKELWLLKPEHLELGYTYGVPVRVVK